VGLFVAVTAVLTIVMTGDTSGCNCGGGGGGGGGSLLHY
jgi:hypothetical protein